MNKRKYTTATAPTSHGAVLRLWGLALLLVITHITSINVANAPQAHTDAYGAPTPMPEITEAAAPIPLATEHTVKFEHLSLEQGLSQSSVMCILQDSRGFMWFGTEDGLNRYDGYTFKVYKHEPNNALSLSQGQISHLYEDRVGMIWVLTSDGSLNKFDPTTEQFHRYSHNPDNPEHTWSDKHVWRTSVGMYAMYGDADGTMWLGTYGGGLVRYDPIVDHFIHYRHNPDDPQSLGHDKVYSIYRDAEGRLWLGTAAGLNRYDETTDRFIRYPYTEPEAFTPELEPQQLSNPYAKIIHQDREGTLWIATLGGLNKFNPETSLFTPYRHDPENEATLSGDLIRVLFEDSTGKFWLAYWDGGVDVFEPRTGHVTHYRHNPNEAHSLSDNYILQIHEDTDGWIWLMTAGHGVDVFDRETGNFIHHQHDPDDVYSLGDNAISAMYEDMTGILWFGTSGRGISLYDRAWHKFPQHRVRAQDNGPNLHDHVGNNVIFGMTSADVAASAVPQVSASQPVAAMWIGTRLGLNYWDRRTDTYTLYAPNPGDAKSLSEGGVWAVYDDGGHATGTRTLWVATNTGLDKATVTWSKSTVSTTAPLLAFTHVFTQGVGDIYAPAGDGGLWLAKPDEGLVYFDPQTGAKIVYAHDPEDETSLLSNWLSVIEPSQKGGLWLGLMDGLDYFDPASETFTHYVHDPDDAHSLSNNVIRALYEDELGRLWVGTGGGLARLTPETGKFHIYREEDGLPNGVIYAIVPDHQGHLWLTTNNGLVKFSLVTQAFKIYTQGDGLPSNEFDFGAYYRAPDGELFFGGVNGFTAFYPENIADDLHPPPIMLTSLTQGGEPIPLREAVEHVQHVSLHWPENFFEFAFTALSYSQPDKNQYAYMLEGFDKDWNYVGTQRFGRYTNLSGGTYTLRLKGANNDGIWNETGIAVEITIVPPVWGTWWFKALAVCVSASLILLGYRLRLKNIKARARSLEIEVARRTAELQRESDYRMRVEEKLREREMAEAVAAERSRLARELHDAVTQTLFSASLIAEALPMLWKINREEGERRLQELRLLSRGALAEMRALLLELRPSALVETGLEELLRQLGEAVTGRSGLQIAVQVHGHCDLPDDVHVTLYRIAQEALNNAVKHAHATEVTVTLDCIAGYTGAASVGVELRVSDNGCGFDPGHTAPDSLGIGIMQERAEAIGAELRILSAPDAGTQVIACWSVEGAEAWEDEPMREVVSIGIG